MDDQNLDFAEFREWVLQRVAHEALSDFTETERHALTLAVVQALASWIDQSRGDGYLVDSADPLVLAVSRWLLALEPQVDGEAAPACAVAAAALADAATKAWQFHTAIGYLTEPGRLDALPQDHLDTMTIHQRLAEVLGRAGHREQAITPADTPPSTASVGQ